MTSQESNKTFRIRRDGQYISIIPAHKEMMSEWTAIRHIPEPDTGGVIPASFPLLWHQTFCFGQQGLQTFAGLEPCLTKWLVERGYKVVQEGGRPHCLIKPNSTRLLRRQLDIDKHLLDFVRQQERGLFVLGDAVLPGLLVAQLATAWPEEQIMVLVTRLTDVVAFRRQLRQLLPKGATGLGHKPTQFTRRVVVTTPGYARKGIHQIDKRTMLICLNPEDCFRSGELASPLDAIRQASRARLYGIETIGQQQSLYIEALKRALFGSERVGIPNHGQIVRPVEVGLWTMKGGPNLNAYQSVRLFRKGVWQHPIRNRLCAKIAKLVCQRSWSELETQFPTLRPLRLRRFSGPVVVLAANLEHALALERELPMSPIVYNRNAWVEDLSAKQQAHLTNTNNRNSSLVIATALGLTQLSNIGVLIRADAGWGLPQLPESELQIGYGSRNRLVVIDCVDRHHPLLRYESQVRQVAYQNADWKIAKVK